LETIGFAPRISRKSLRSMSGMGRLVCLPYSREEVSRRGSASTEFAVKRLRVPRLVASRSRKRKAE